eukprot:gnl/TRDRNA2_/TRDRNA2_170538_c1_seq1.p1 gnl/TRDRNA2_/TRDRNA2_170538_c1~~gnl/TRDRNA2_/TRDRNA2_170538_c1_seq1.p1  ORF type:complete len:954 (+),score=191.39 gnl/TRDRNA2_/TRDRNA2_170538_c1_seq1:1-2862(+)
MEFDPDAYNRFITGDLTGLCSAHGDTEFIEEELSDSVARGSVGGLAVNDELQHHKRGGGARAFKQMLRDREKAEILAALAAVKKHDLGMSSVKGFKEALRVRCGSLLGAWRGSLDLDGNGRISVGEFSVALNRLGMHGNIKGLWKGLDPDNRGFIEFKDLDPETDAMLQEFRQKFNAAYGNMLLAWMKGLDSVGSGCVDEPVFVKACEKVGCSFDTRKLFKSLQPEAGRRFISLQDIDTPAYNALSRGDFRMISEEGVGDVPHKKPLEMTFHERNEAGFFWQVRKAWDAAQRDDFKKACRMAGYAKESFNEEDFLHLCIRKYGTIMNAWRQCLDADGNGKLTFGEFAQACRYLGYAGDIKKLWKSLDDDNSGSISIRELDSQADDMIKAFLSLLQEKFGDMETAWRRGFGKDPHDSIDEGALKEACDLMGYPYDAHKLFKNLQPMPGRQLITIWDIDPECSRERARGTKATINVSTAADAERHPLAAKRKFGGSLHDSLFPDDNASSANGSVRRQTNWDAMAIPRGGITDKVSTLPAAGNANVVELRKVLVRQFGSTVCAWRTAFDPHMTGKVSFGKWCIVLQNANFYGSVKKIWVDLVGERKTMALKDLDNEAAELLDKFREGLLAQHPSILEAWWKGLDKEGAGKLDEEQFIASVQRLGGCGVKNPKRMFKFLLNRIGQRSLAPEDLEPLLIGVPPDDRLSTWSVPKEDGTADLTGPAPSHYKTPEPSSGSKTLGLPTPLECQRMKSPRAQIDEMREAYHGRDKVMNTLDGFKKMLVVKYGSLFAAWRHFLDADHNGIVTATDFSIACRKLGVKENRALWKAIDENQNGQISIHELDFDLGEAFEEFENLLIEQYGSTKEGWRKGLDLKGSLRLEEEDWCKRLRAIGYSKDPLKLYKMLRPEPGRAYLTYDDIWMNLNPNEVHHEADNMKKSEGSPRPLSGRSPRPASGKK